MPTTKKQVGSSFARKDLVSNQLEILMKGLEQGGRFEDLFPKFQEPLQGLRGDINEDEYKVYLGQLVKHRDLNPTYMEQISQFLSVRSVIERPVQNVEEQVSAPAKFGVAVGSVNSLNHSKPGQQQTKYFERVASKLLGSTEVSKISPISLLSYTLGSAVFPITFTRDGIIVPEGILKGVLELYNQKAGTSFTLSKGALIRTVPYKLLSQLGVKIGSLRRHLESGKARSDNLDLASPMPKVGEETVRDYFLPNGGSEMDVSRCLFPEDKEREESADQSAPKTRAQSSWIRAVVSFITYPVRMLLLACWMILSAIWAGMSVLGSKLLGGFSSQVAWDEPAKVNFEIASTPSGEFRGVPRVNSRGAKVTQSNLMFGNIARCENL